MIRMRDKNLNYIKFCDQIEVFVTRKTKTIEILRRAVVTSPTLLEENFKLKFHNNKLINLRGLAVLSYYVPEILGWKIRFELEEKAKRLNLKDKKKLELLLISKEIALCYLYETNEFSSHEIFGNVIDKGLETLKFLKIIERKIRVKKTQRRRGYDDKGSLRSQDRWLPSHDYTLTNLQNKINKETDLHKRVIHYLEIYLCEKIKFYLEE